MTATGTLNLTFNQYATFQTVLVWIGSGCGCSTVGASSGPIDLTGYTAAMQIRPFPNGPVLYDASGDITLGGVAGTISLNIPAADTATMTWWMGQYDLLLTSSQGISTRLLMGSVTVIPGVTP